MNGTLPKVERQVSSILNYPIQLQFQHCPPSDNDVLKSDSSPIFVYLSLYWYTFYILYIRLLVLRDRIKLGTTCTLALYINQWPTEQLFYYCSIGSHMEPMSLPDGPSFLLLWTVMQPG